VEKAKAVIILSNKLTLNPSKEDAKTILKAMVLKNYMKTKTIKGVTPQLRVCM
jgi:hypothetical protein